VTAPDTDQLNAAADRGMLAAFWAAERGDAPAVISDVGNRTRAEANANANRLVRAVRARGAKAGDGIALMCSNRPEFWETVAAARRAGL
jgi:long-chain acyl-CoA synthetase